MLVTALSASAQKRVFPKLTGPYLGQKPPGMTPEVFTPGIISTGNHEFWISVSPDGGEIYYTLRGGLLGHGYNVVLYMYQNKNDWKGPFVVPFSGRYSDKEQCLYENGNKIVFNSKRPKSGKGEPEELEDIWTTERVNGKWTEPKLLTDSDLGERRMSPCITNSGNLYFSGNYENTENLPDIYRSKFINGKYSIPEKLGGDLNSEYFESHVFVSPDERFIIFDSDRPDGFGETDMYISFQLEDGSFSKSVNLGEKINSASNDSAPFVTRDGKYFFFFSDRTDVKNYSEKPLSYSEIINSINQPKNGYGDIYWVDAKIINELKPK
jgi:Tol biopolymer transport system component